jgi:mannan endo-1,4-beta-mannosidase
MPLRLLTFLLFTGISTVAQSWISVKEHQLLSYAKPHYYIGTNYWYGSLIASDPEKSRGIERVRRDLDFLKRNGVTNLRLMGGAEGTGTLNGIPRVGPPFQIAQGAFDESALNGLDIVLDEMARRDMRAVIFVSNNWEWSGGFQQYLLWNNEISKEWLIRKPDWDTLRDMVAKFYNCTPCKYSYARQAARLVRRVNTINGKRYRDDPTIMSWQIANEPRPMRPAAIESYKRWIAETALQFQNLAPNQLVSVGHEGWVGSEGMEVYESIHADPNVDYLTIHIWPKNWAWFADGRMTDEYAKFRDETVKYINDHLAVARKLNKPLVIEEFGLPRDAQSFEPSSTTKIRDRYFAEVLSFVRKYPNVAGANFWAFGGDVRPPDLWWKPGAEYTGDPPMEQQGLYSVFAYDRPTWKTIRSHAKRVRR